jgi:hypothetical protein
MKQNLKNKLKNVFFASLISAPALSVCVHDALFPTQHELYRPVIEQAHKKYVLNNGPLSSVDVYYFGDESVRYTQRCTGKGCLSGFESVDDSLESVLEMNTNYRCVDL